MAALNLARRPPALSPERQALAALILERDEAVRRGQALAAAADVATQTVWRLSTEVEQAEQALQEAKEGLAEHALAVAAGQAPVGPSPVQAAREQRAAAEAALTDARLARDALDERLRQPGNGGFAEQRVREAALAVIGAEAGPHASRLTKRVSDLRRSLARASHEWRWLIRNGALPLVQEEGAAYGKPVDAEARALLWRTDPQYVNGADDLSTPALRGDGPWIEALEALQHDAAAALPVMV